MEHEISNYKYSYLGEDGNILVFFLYNQNKEKKTQTILLIFRIILSKFNSNFSNEK